MKRGCGFLTFHFSTFAPQKYARQMLEGSGGYFQWESDGKRQWYSAITTLDDLQTRHPAEELTWLQADPLSVQQMTGILIDHPGADCLAD